MVSVVDERSLVLRRPERSAHRLAGEGRGLAVNDASRITDRAGELRARIDAAGGVDRVTLVAVTKGFGPEVVEGAIGAGLFDLGENYAQELVRKAAIKPPLAEAVRWHFLGALQTNKASRLAPLVSRWHGIDREAAGTAVAQRRAGAAIFVEVNVAAIAGRPGCRMEDTEGLVGFFVDQGLDVRGLMTVAPRDNPSQTRQVFRRLAAQASRLGLGELSMGMSDDFEIAIEEGATTVRLGRALFGPRPGVAGAQR